MQYLDRYDRAHPRICRDECALDCLCGGRGDPGEYLGQAQNRQSDDLYDRDYAAGGGAGDGLAARIVPIGADF